MLWRDSLEGGVVTIISTPSRIVRDNVRRPVLVVFNVAVRIELALPLLHELGVAALGTNRAAPNRVIVALVDVVFTFMTFLAVDGLANASELLQLVELVIVIVVLLSFLHVNLDVVYGVLHHVVKLPLLLLHSLLGAHVDV